MLTRAVLSCGATRLMTMISPAIAIAPSAVNTSPLPTPPATPFGPASSTSPTNTIATATATASHAIGCWRLRKNSHWSSGASGTWKAVIKADLVLLRYNRPEVCSE